MKHFFLFFLILTLAAGIAHAQKERGASQAALVWNDYYDLGWHDFEGVPGEDAVGDAGTVVQIKAKPYLIQNKVEYDVVAVFLRNKSWVIGKSDQLLAHERLHFDIAELYARKIRKKVLDLKERNITDLKIYNAAVKEILDESNAADIQYDTETLHGSLLRKQETWEAKVAEQLHELDGFKRQKRVITSG